MLWVALWSLAYLVAGFGTLVLLVSGRQRPLASGLVGLATILFWPLALPNALLTFVASVVRGRRRARKDLAARAPANRPKSSSREVAAADLTGSTRG